MNTYVDIVVVSPVGKADALNSLPNVIHDNIVNGDGNNVSTNRVMNAIDKDKDKIRAINDCNVIVGNDMGFLDATLI